MGSQKDDIINCLIEQAEGLGPPRGECPRCRSGSGFKMHDRRPRKILAVEGNYVLKAEITLHRWKCVSCRSTFTHYPEFIAPYRRYAVISLIPMAENYLNDPTTGYRRAVTHGGMPIGYVDIEDGRIDDRQMSHSSLWRFMTWIGCLQILRDKAIDLLRQKDPCFELHRATTPICPGKYRSSARKQLLENAAALMQINANFMRHFTRAIFPRLWNRAYLKPG